MFTLLQWSDAHAKTNNVTATQNAISTATVDAVVNCGDLVDQYFESGIANINLSKTLCVVGNHDAILQAGTTGSIYQWSMQPTQTQLRERYIAPLVKNLGVSSPEGSTWWKKLVNGIMLVGINDTLIEKNIVDAQLSWFKSVLSECVSNDYPLVVIKHGPSRYTQLLDCNFTCRKAFEKKSAEIEEYASAYPQCDACIGELVTTSAKVMCVIHGHDHYDAFGYITKADTTKIPVIGINSTQVDSWGDLARSTSPLDSTSIVMNQIEYDSGVDSLRVYRLGANGSAMGCYRKMLVHSYAANGVVTTCSNRG